MAYLLSYANTYFLHEYRDDRLKVRLISSNFLSGHTEPPTSGEVLGVKLKLVIKLQLIYLWWREPDGISHRDKEQH